MKRNIMSSSQIKEEPLVIETQVNYDPSIIQRFFKVMVHDFHKELILPPVICMKLKGKTRNGAVLISCKGEWGVKISGRANGEMYFKHGWGAFVKAHGLKFGDFVMFEHHGNMQFKVWVYDSSYCQKDFFLADVKDEDVKDQSVKDEGVEGEDVGRQLYEITSTRIKRGRPQKISNNSQKSREFYRKIRKENLTNAGVNLPKIFVRLNKFEGRTLALLTGPSEESHEVKLGQNLRGSFLSSGWVDFCKANNIQEGDICLFKLTHDSPKSFGPVKMDLLHSLLVSDLKKVWFDACFSVGRPRKISNNSQESREFYTKISHQNLTIVGLKLPKIFVTLNKLESRTLALLTGPSRKLCEVKLVQGQRGSVLREGWLYFCKENKIQEGDICHFKLTSPEGFAPMKMDVEVISAPN